MKKKNKRKEIQNVIGEESDESDDVKIKGSGLENKIEKKMKQR